MALSTDEEQRLNNFSRLNLNKTRIETFLSCKLTDQEWESYNQEYKYYSVRLMSKLQICCNNIFRVRATKPSHEEIEILTLQKQHKNWSRPWSSQATSQNLRLQKKFHSTKSKSSDYSQRQATSHQASVKTERHWPAALVDFDYCWVSWSSHLRCNNFNSQNRSSN